MVRPAKVLKIELSDYGAGLHTAEGCFEIRNNGKTVACFPFFEKTIGECVLKSGTYVSTDALISLCLWNVTTFIATKTGRIVGILKSLEDFSHVKTRVAQYEALKNGKGLAIAKTIVLSKIEGQNMVLRKYGLEQLDLMGLKAKVEGLNGSLEALRYRINQIEGKASQHYFSQIFGLFPDKLRPERRVGFKAYDGLNNVFNFGYYVLKCRVYKALLKAKLEPYLGFLHAMQHGKPSLVCDFMELYRYLIDDFLIERRTRFHKKDFVAITDFILHLRMGKRIHLCEFEADRLAEDLNSLFERKVQIPRIKHGEKQTLDTLICEEALLLAKFLRGERSTWIPRLPLI